MFKKEKSKVHKVRLFNKAHVLTSKVQQLGSGCALGLGTLQACLLIKEKILAVNQLLKKIEYFLTTIMCERDVVRTNHLLL